ncbi:hypothetical protein [Citrobacter werkmanii]|uniref:hypothetical protein n=1 Tax=Citrobacter werkmanii TaxID=67827 RepID=UPI0037C556C6
MRTMLSKLFAWLFRRKKKTIAVTIPVGAGKTGRVIPRPAMTPVTHHRAGGAVDPALFKDAKLSKPEIPHSDPSSPFYPYWLDAQMANAGAIAGFEVDCAAHNAPVDEGHHRHHSHHSAFDNNSSHDDSYHHSSHHSSDSSTDYGSSHHHGGDNW